MLSGFASRIARLGRSPSIKRTKKTRLSVAELEHRDVPATGLGIANDFSAFVLHDANLFNSDVQGRVAVGNDASFTAYGIGDQLPNSNGTVDVLIVGDDLTFTNGQVNAGNVVYGDTGTFASFGHPNGTIRQDTVIDFVAAGNELRGLADSYAALAQNGTVQNNYGTIILKGTNPVQNVFNINASLLWNANDLRINAPAGSSVIVNITGTNARMQFMGYHLEGGVDNDNVILNFHNANNLTLQGIGIFGNVLAPRAFVNFNNGQINGTLVANSWCGYGQVNFERPCEPPPPPPCEPPPPPPCDPPPPPKDDCEPPPPPPCDPPPPPKDDCEPPPPPKDDCDPPPPPPCDPPPPPKDDCPPPPKDDCEPPPPKDDCEPPPPPKDDCPPPPKDDCEPPPPPKDDCPPPPPPPCDPPPPPKDDCPPPNCVPGNDCPPPPQDDCPPCEPGLECPPCEPEPPCPPPPPPPPPPCDPPPPPKDDCPKPKQAQSASAAKPKNHVKSAGWHAKSGHSWNTGHGKKIGYSWGSSRGWNARR